MIKKLLVTYAIVLAGGCSGGSESRTVALDGSAEGTVALDGGTDGAVALDGSTDGAVALDGSADGAVALDGSADGAVALDGGTDGAVALDGSADGAAPPDENACGTHDQPGPQLVVDTLGPPGGVYEGPALVERSTADEMILGFALPTSTADAAATTAMCARLSGLSPMPILPLAAKVWLSKNPAGNSPCMVEFGPPCPWALTVRDQQGGTILFGAALDTTMSSGVALTTADQTSAPIATGTMTPICVGANPLCPWAAGNKVTYLAVEVQGDTPVTIADSQTATVRLSGVDYSVRVTAQEVTVDPSGCMADYVANSQLSVDVQAKDLQSLINTLEVSSASVGAACW
ncbi:MAG: hypothetical protein ACLP66_10180 [Polyangia bacterium]